MQEALSGGGGLRWQGEKKIFFASGWWCRRYFQRVGGNPGLRGQGTKLFFRFDPFFEH